MSIWVGSTWSRSASAISTRMLSRRVVGLQRHGARCSLGRDVPPLPERVQAPDLEPPQRSRHERVDVQRAVARLGPRSEEHTSELQSHVNLVCRLLLEKKNIN